MIGWRGGVDWVMHWGFWGEVIGLVVVVVVGENGCCEDGLYEFEGEASCVQSMD